MLLVFTAIFCSNFELFVYYNNNQQMTQNYNIKPAKFKQIHFIYR